MFDLLNWITVYGVLQFVHTKMKNSLWIWSGLASCVQQQMRISKAFSLRAE